MTQMLCSTAVVLLLPVALRDVHAPLMQQPISPAMTLKVLPTAARLDPLLRRATCVNSYQLLLCTAGSAVNLF
jgi:hypothetical protein